MLKITDKGIELSKDITAEDIKVLNKGEHPIKMSAKEIISFVRKIEGGTIIKHNGVSISSADGKIVKFSNDFISDYLERVWC